MLALEAFIVLPHFSQTQIPKRLTRSSAGQYHVYADQSRNNCLSVFICEFFCVSGADMTEYSN